jgi:hypothetical protein
MKPAAPVTRNFIVLILASPRSQAVRYVVGKELKSFSRFSRSTGAVNQRPGHGGGMWSHCRGFEWVNGRAETDCKKLIPAGRSRFILGGGRFDQDFAYA